MRSITTPRSLLTSLFFRRVFLSWSMAVFALALGMPVFADGGGPMRPSTPAEMAAHKHVHTTFGNALPKLPAGWTEESGPSKTELKEVPQGSEKEVMRFYLNRRWLNSTAMEKARLDETAAIEAAGTEMQDRQKTMDSFQKEQTKLAEQFGKAIEKGDMVEAQRLQAEIEAFTKKNFEPLIKASDEQMKKVRRQTSLHDGEITFIAAFNAPEASIEAQKIEPSPIEGGLVYRVPGHEEESGGWQESKTHIFIGPWKEEKQEGSTYLSLIPSLSIDAGHERPQNLYLQITADEARTTQLIKEFDWTSLKGLLTWKP